MHSRSGYGFGCPLAVDVIAFSLFPWSSSLPHLVSVFSSGYCPPAGWTGRVQKHEKEQIVDICPRLGSQRRVAANWLWDTCPRQSWPHVAKKGKGQWDTVNGYHMGRLPVICELVPCPFWKTYLKLNVEITRSRTGIIQGLNKLYRRGGVTYFAC